MTSYASGSADYSDAVQITFLKSLEDPLDLKPNNPKRKEWKRMVAEQQYQSLA